MDFETWFSIASAVAMLGWLLLLVSPLIPTWSDRLAGFWMPGLLCAGYLGLLLMPSSGGGGFGSLAEVIELFSYERSALAGWVHFLAFDLFVGAWICRTARTEGMSFWMALPSLPVTFLFGPAGLLSFWAIRAVRGRIRRDG